MVSLVWFGLGRLLHVLIISLVWFLSQPRGWLNLLTLFHGTFHNDAQRMMVMKKRAASPPTRSHPSYPVFRVRRLLPLNIGLGVCVCVCVFIGRWLSFVARQYHGPWIAAVSSQFDSQSVFGSPWKLKKKWKRRHGKTMDADGRIGKTESAINQSINQSLLPNSKNEMPVEFPHTN